MKYSLSKQDPRLLKKVGDLCTSLTTKSAVIVEGGNDDVIAVKGNQKRHPNSGAIASITTLRPIPL